jgi:hypothetical protein
LDDRAAASDTGLDSSGPTLRCGELIELTARLDEG